MRDKCFDDSKANNKSTPKGHLAEICGEGKRVIRRMLLEEVTFTLNKEILKNIKYVTVMNNEK